MSLPVQSGLVGPLRWIWQPHVRGAAAEPVVRAWLGTLLEHPASAFPIIRDRYGRPRLAGRFAQYDLGWSHSGEGLLAAFCDASAGDVDLGVDLERLRPHPRALELARRFFTGEEADWLHALPADHREPAFVRLWCAKEAVLKAHGRGLAFGLHRLAFGERDHHLQLLVCDPALGAATDWTVHECTPHPGYRAALAWRSRRDG